MSIRKHVNYDQKRGFQTFSELSGVKADLLLKQPTQAPIMFNTQAWTFLVDKIQVK